MTIQPLEYYREKERAAYSTIPGVEQILFAKPVERDKLETQYPDAAFALMIADNLCGLDREQCYMNQDAYFSILNGENIAEIRFRYNEALRRYVERHLWDDWCGQMPAMCITNKRGAGTHPSRVSASFS